MPVFIFDKYILDELEEKADRPRGIHSCGIARNAGAGNRTGQQPGSVLRYSLPKYMTQLMKKYKIEKVFTNGDYEPYAMQRDAAIAKITGCAGSILTAIKTRLFLKKRR